MDLETENEFGRRKVEAVKGGDSHSTVDVTELIMKLSPCIVKLFRRYFSHHKVFSVASLLEQSAVLNCNCN